MKIYENCALLIVSVKQIRIRYRRRSMLKGILVIETLSFQQHSLSRQSVRIWTGGLKIFKNSGVSLRIFSTNKNNIGLFSSIIKRIVYNYCTIKPLEIFLLASLGTFIRRKETKKWSPYYLITNMLVIFRPREVVYKKITKKAVCTSSQ